MVDQREPVVIVASAEFALKSYPVRRSMEQRLIDDLRVALARGGLDGFRVEKHAARLVVQGLSERETELAAQLCSRVFGVVYAVPAITLTSSIEPIVNEIVRTAQASLRPGQSFAVRCHRTTETEMPRHEIEVKGGAAVLQALTAKSIRVDLRNPDLTIWVDLAEDRAYVYGNKLHGPGGLPLSSQWKMLAILDSGPLTILAAFAMMRRGCLVELLIPISDRLSQFSKESQFALATKLRALVTRPTYRAFTIQLDDFEEGRSYGYADMRKLVHSLVTRIAKEKKYRGIVISDVAGQLEEFKPENLESTDRSAELPHFHPLLGLDFEDLMELCRSAGLSVGDLISQVRSDTQNEVTGSLATIERTKEFVVNEIRL